MLFRITHTTTYTYSQAVTLGPHVIRLRPRPDDSQRLLDFQLHIEPEPLLLNESLDLEGNLVHHAGLTGDTDRLRVTSTFTLETLRSDPFDYRLEPGFNRLPAAYDNYLEVLLAPYREEPAIADSVSQFAHGLAAEAGAEPMAFLTTLNTRLHQMINREIRPEGNAQLPEVTLATQKGACRDLTVLFMAACRAQGLATRFVSGYQKGHPERQHRYLHAWSEVYLPGGGWRGYDPTHGVIVTDEHVPLAAARTQEGTMPIQGTFTFNGASVTSQLDFSLTIEAE
jgi:transglutaminase-like putative cysteine protease